jgi:hypothetical protein
VLSHSVTLSLSILTDPHQNWLSILTKPSIVSQSYLNRLSHSLGKSSLSISLALGSWVASDFARQVCVQQQRQICVHYAETLGELLLDCSVVSNFSFNLNFCWFLFCELLLVMVLSLDICFNMYYFISKRSLDDHCKIASSSSFF